MEWCVYSLNTGAYVGTTLLTEETATEEEALEEAITLYGEDVYIKLEKRW